jgi:hypothetical protein
VLLRNNCNTTHANLQGKTALALAFESRLETCLQLLLSHGAEANFLDPHGNTALHLAVLYSLPQIVSQLLERVSSFAASFTLLVPLCLLLSLTSLPGSRCCCCQQCQSTPLGDSHCLEGHCSSTYPSKVRSHQLFVPLTIHNCCITPSRPIGTKTCVLHARSGVATKTPPSTLAQAV